MYRCDSCGRLAAPRVRSHRVVIETRDVIHPRRPNAQPVPGKPRKLWRDDPGGTGTQVVREIACCPGCLRAHRREDR
jgi:hypothetical protein